MTFIIAVGATLVVTGLAGRTDGHLPGHGAGQMGDGGPVTGALPTGATDVNAGSGVVERGSGTFMLADGSTERVGSGTVLRYRVAVEKGIGQRPAAFAEWVDRVLADPRGWTGRGEWAFERPSDGPVDFVVRLASPSTVDDICGRFGVDTEGEASCRGGDQVVINLRRWLLAIPAYDGDTATYRHLVINHEVGHFLGLFHAECPGLGQPAPVMQTQMYGMHGCVPNGWPYP